MAVLTMLVAGSSSFGAEPSADSVRLTARVAPCCRLSAADLEFGSYDPLATNEIQPLDAETTISLTCTRAASAVLRLDAAGAGLFMRAAGEELAYGLFRDGERTKPFTTVTVVGQGPMKPETIPVFGRVAPSQAVPDGAYRDFVIFQVDF